MAAPVNAAQRAGENVKHSRSGSNGQENRSTEKDVKTSRIKYRLIEHNLVIVAAAAQRD
jgi:fructose-specific phosphotransferase system component IIB